MPEAKKKAARETKSHQVSIRLSAEAYRKLRELAEKEDRKPAYILRRAVLGGLGLDSKAA